MFYSILIFLKAAQRSIHFQTTSGWIRGPLKKSQKQTTPPNITPQLYFIKYESKNFTLVGNSTLKHIRMKIFEARFNTGWQQRLGQSHLFLCLSFLCEQNQRGQHLFCPSLGLDKKRKVPVPEYHHCVIHSSELLPPIISFIHPKLEMEVKTT